MNKKIPKLPSSLAPGKPIVHRVVSQAGASALSATTHENEIAFVKVKQVLESNDIQLHKTQ